MTPGNRTDLPPGDLRLLDDPIATRLIASDTLARVAYVAQDGTPRVVPVGFVRTGDRLVFATFAGSPKIAALRANPAVAITVDRPGPPPEVLLIRGHAEVADVDGVPPEYRQMQERYYGAEQAAAAVTQLETAGARMALVSVTPTWVQTLDFTTRLPAAMARRSSG